MTLAHVGGLPVEELVPAAVAAAATALATLRAWRSRRAVSSRPSSMTGALTRHESGR